MEDLTGLMAKVKVKITKLDEDGKLIGEEEHETLMSAEEARNLWQSQMQD